METTTYYRYTIQKISKWAFRQPVKFRGSQGIHNWKVRMNPDTSNYIKIYPVLFIGKIFDVSERICNPLTINYFIPLTEDYKCISIYVYEHFSSNTTQTFRRKYFLTLHRKETIYTAPGKSTTKCRETSVSRHHGGPIESPPQASRYHTTVML